MLPTYLLQGWQLISLDILFENIMSLLKVDPVLNLMVCWYYIETNYGKGSLIDFNYETEPFQVLSHYQVWTFGLLKIQK